MLAQAPDLTGLPSWFAVEGARRFVAGGHMRPSWRHHSAILTGPRLALAKPPSGGLAQGWQDAYAAGLALLPMGLDQGGGKVPLVKYRGTCRAGRAACEKWAARMPGALLACRTALSGITVVDLDSKSPKLLARVVARYGEPRIIAATPKGHHCYYRGGNHPRYSRDVPGLEGEPIDVRSSSASDLVILPGSWTPTGDYRFIKGGWSDFARLTEPTPGTLDKPTRTKASGAPRKAPSKTPSNPAGLTVDVMAGELVPEGERARFLFAAARDLLTDPAIDMPSLERLVAALHQVNAQWCDPPAADCDIANAAKGAWIYKSERRCLPAYVLRPRLGRGAIVPDRVQTLGPVAAELWRVLRRANWNRPGGFRVVVEGLRARMPEGSRKTAHVQAAKRALIEAGELVQLRGKFKRPDGGWEAALFAFPDLLPLSRPAYPISFPRTEEEPSDGPALSRSAA